MKTDHLKSILALPVNVLVVVPIAIVWLTNSTAYSFQPASISQIQFWVGVAAAVKGLILMAWTISDFVRIGKGTLAPWKPTQNLVVKGPYRHVRNPMISGAFLVLLAEALLLQSLPVGGWAFVFMVANAVYIPLSEEKALEKRFGEEYRRYKKNVPRWFPRLTPWFPS
ncbi:MAG: methyltransferase family protein [Nitrospinales bacterium]